MFLLNLLSITPASSLAPIAVESPEARRLATESGTNAEKNKDNVLLIFYRHWLNAPALPGHLTKRLYLFGDAFQR